MQLACLLTRGTGGRSLPISSCYTGSASLVFALKTRRHQPEPDTTISVPFRPHSSAHSAVSSWPMAVAECTALLHCPEVRAMRLWPLIEHDWLRVRSRCRCCDTGACFDCGAMSGAAARVQQPDAMPPGVAVDVGGVCAHYRETEGRALAISTCYTGSAGSLSSLSQHGRHQPE